MAQNLQEYNKHMNMDFQLQIKCYAAQADSKTPASKDTEISIQKTDYAG